MSTPESVGDLAEFDITFTPPVSNPTAIVTSAAIVVVHPDGDVDPPVPMVVVTPNVWRYIADDRIDAPGMWTWEWSTEGTLQDSGAVSVYILPQRSTVGI